MLFGFCGALSAADYYISPSGLDGSPGSLAQPWQSFAHAVPQLAAGDTLHLRAGIYAERLIEADPGIRARS